MTDLFVSSVISVIFGVLGWGLRIVRCVVKSQKYDRSPYAMTKL